MPEIQLTQDKVALVDEIDFDRVDQYRWFAHKGSRTFYAERVEYHGAKTVTHIKMHREILEQMIGRKIDQGEFADHINHNGLDNRRDNLRLVSARENSANTRKKLSPAGSNFKGVTWDPKKKAWLVQINNGCGNKTIGRFQSEIDAAHAYDMAALHAFGEYANINFENPRAKKRGGLKITQSRFNVIRHEVDKLIEDLRSGGQYLAAHDLKNVQLQLSTIHADLTPIIYKIAANRLEEIAAQGIAKLEELAAPAIQEAE